VCVHVCACMSAQMYAYMCVIMCTHICEAAHICAARILDQMSKYCLLFQPVMFSYQREDSVTWQVDQLRCCISVLFMFQRKSTQDDVFLRDTRGWLSIMVSTMGYIVKNGNIFSLNLRIRYSYLQMALHHSIHHGLYC